MRPPRVVVALAASERRQLFVRRAPSGHTSEWELHGVYERTGNLNENLGVVDSDVACVQAGVGNTQVAITQLQALVAALQTALDNLKTQLSDVSRDLSQKLYVNKGMNTQLLELLLVPDGSRKVPASLLTCTGDSGSTSPCPPVVVNCASKTGDCSFNAH